MARLAEIFGRIIGDEYTGIRVADYLSENPHARVNDLVKFRGVGMENAKTINDVDKVCCSLSVDFLINLKVSVILLTIT